MKHSIRYDRLIIDSLRRMAVFAKVVECGSFKKAADQLALSPSVVSHHISQLEEMIGKPLLYRTTRSVSVTDEGAIFLKATLDMLHSAHSAFDEIAKLTQTISGELKVGLATALSRAKILQTITELEKQFPDITLSLSFSDILSMSENSEHDVILLFGEPSGDGLLKRKISDVERVIVASPAYLQNRDIPQSLDSLKACDWIWPSSARRTLSYRNRSKKGTVQRLSITPRTLVDNNMACRRLALEGTGLTVMPNFAVREDISDGRLLRISPDLEITPDTLYAAWPKNSTKTTLTHLFVEYIAKSFQDQNTA